MSAPASRSRVRARPGAGRDDGGRRGREAGLPASGPKAIVVVRDPRRPAARPGLGAGADTEVTPVGADTEDGLNVLRHSTAHVLAQAVQDLFPEAKLGIGPPIENGFYYDFDVAKPFTPDDLDKLEKRMQEIVKAGQRFRRRRSTRSTRPRRSWPTSRTSSSWSTSRATASTPPR